MVSFIKLNGKTMPDSLNKISNDEIDLSEMFNNIWAYKLLIVFITFISISVGVFFVLNADKKFESEVIFKFDDGRSNNLPFIGELNALASFGGMGGIGVSGITLPTDQVRGRVFIEKIDKKLNLRQDVFYNKYDPDYIEPVWKAIIKSIIGWEKSTLNDDEITWQKIIKVYTNNIFIDETDNGSIRIVVKHENAQRAADIANEIMRTVVATSQNKKSIQQDDLLKYLSKILAKSLKDLEVSQQNLKVFAIENGIMKLEDFANDSLKLNTLRQNFKDTSELYDAVLALHIILKKDDAKSDDYVQLRKKHPIVDKVDFRRILGLSEIISAWSWPSTNVVIGVLDMLSERKKTIQSEILTSERITKKSGKNAEIYTKLVQENEIAKATYEVLIEQVKAQSMIVGYSPDKTEIYQYASPSINPSEPKSILIIISSAFIGLFLGTLMALILANRRGVFSSKKSLIINTNANFNLSIKNLKPLRNLSLENLNKYLKKNPNKTLRNLAIEIYNCKVKQIIISSSKTKLKGIQIARAIGVYMQSKNDKIAIINFSEEKQRIKTNIVPDKIDHFLISDNLSHLNILNPTGEINPLDLITKRDFSEMLEELNASYDLILLCADNNDAMSLIRAVNAEKSFHLMHASFKRTKQEFMLEMHSTLPIQGLIHD